MNTTKSLRRFLLICILSIVILAGLTTAFFNYSAVGEQVEELFDAELAQMARVLQSLLKGTDLPTSKRSQTLIYEDFVNSRFDTFQEKNLASAIEFTNYGHRYEKKLAFQVWDRSGMLLIQTHTAEKSKIPLLPPGFNQFTSDEGLWHTFTLVDEDEGNRIQVAQKNDVRSELTNQIAIQQIVAPLVITPVVALLIWYLIGYAFSPLHRLSNQVSSLNIKNLQPIGDHDIPAEIQVLVSSLNELFTRVRNQAIRERRFTADVAHELRTPLAALKIQLQNSMRRLAENPARKSIQKAQLALENIISLVELLLLLNKLETTYNPEDTTSVDIGDSISQIVSLLEAKRAQAQVTIKTELQENITVKAHSSMIQALIRNLLENALKYSPPGGQIDITLADGKLMISDCGAGIPEQELESVFERFYRVEGHTSTGSGLGLAICRQIASLYGFSIQLENRKDVSSGITASIHFTRPVGQAGLQPIVKPVLFADAEQLSS
jgi:two-component system, OmpR family, sensor histidine kinase QseC